MPTIIDSLIVELGLDTTKFTEGQTEMVDKLRQTKDNVEKHSKEIEGFSKNIAEGFNGVVKSLGVLTAGYLTASSISSFIQQTNQTNFAVNQLSTTLGLTVENLSRYRAAAKQAGIDPNAVVQTVQGVSSTLNAVQRGTAGGDFWQANSRLGVQGNLIGPDGKPIPVEEYLRRVQDAVRRTQESGRYNNSQITDMLQSLGINAQTAYVLEDTNQGIDKFLKNVKSADATTKSQSDSSVKAAQSYGKLETAVDTLGRVFAENLNPELEKTYKWLHSIVEWFTEHIGVFQTIAGIISGAATGAAIGLALPIPGGALGGAVAGGIAGGITGYGLPTKGGAARGAGGSNSAPAAGGTSLDGLKGSEYLRKQRESRIQEIESDPQLKENVLKMLQLEEGSVTGKTAAMEALLNRSVMTGNTIREELFSGFYGPINRGGLRAALTGRARDSSEKAYALGRDGSNLILGRTDQGMVGDPNANGPGRIKVPGTSGIFNYWKGSRRGRYFSHEDSAKFSDDLNKHANDGSDWGKNARPVPWLGAVDPALGPRSQNNTTNNRQSSFSMGNVTVHTAAQNASELAADLSEHMRSRMTTILSTTGLA